MYVEILRDFTFSFAILLITFFTGSIINAACELFPFKKNNLYARIFAGVSIGTIFWVASFAVFCCAGKSIFSGLFLLFIFYWALSKKRQTADSMKKEITQSLTHYSQGAGPLIISLGIFVGSFLFILFQIFPEDIHNYILTWPDNLYYADLSKGINALGIENRNSNFSSVYQPQGTTLYHYFDIWLNIILIQVFNANALQGLLLIVFPVLLFLSIIGSFSFISYFSEYKIRPWYLLVMVMIMISANTHDSFFLKSSVFSSADLMQVYYPGYYFHHKILINYIFLLLSTNALFNQNPLLFIFWAVSVCFCYATTIPGIMAGSLLFCLYGYFTSSDKKEYPVFKMLLLIGVGVAFCLLFDRFTSDEPKKILESNQIPKLKTIVALILEWAAKYTIAYIPMILVALRLWRLNDAPGVKNVIWGFAVFTAGAFIGSTLFAQINRAIIDVNQAIYNIMPVLFTLLSLLIIARYFFLSSENLSIKKAVLVSFCLSGFFLLLFDIKTEKSFDISYHKYSNDYVNKCLNEVNNSTSSRPPVIVAISSGPVLWWSYVGYNRPGQFLTNSKVTSGVLDITPYFRDNCDSFCSNNLNLSSPVCQWIQHKDSLPKDRGARLDSFISRFNINYLISENKDFFQGDSTPRSLVLVARDKNTGESFYRISK